MSPSCAFYFEEELLSLFHTSLIFHIRQSRHDNAAEVRVPGYYSLGRRCPCLCYFASMWEIKRRNCSFIDQLPLKATCPGQTRSFLTFFFLQWTQIRHCHGHRQPVPRTRVVLASRYVPQVICHRYPARTMEILAPRGPLPQPDTGARGDSNRGHSAAKGKHG